ncbi:MAG TPA: helix-turn-helix domain-containing protein [Methylophaga aminisulfidivorans]|uniref:Helix-turn-helix domain-containing protein n=2 Tax=root TaxID=1 RepID=A0A7C1W0J6_9GAMM|nr:helix-turn-helix domain-containing protein [Methylophaga aminisulfidivorans]
MTATSNSNSARKGLLTPSQVTRCKKIIASESDQNQRASVLLALHTGATQLEAAKQSDLSLNQVKYCVSRFRKVGMAMFPETTMLKQSMEEVTIASSPAEIEPPLSTTQKKAKKKSKKSKASKKEKRTNKDKPTKKDKKKKKKSKKK